MDFFVDRPEQMKQIAHATRLSQLSLSEINVSTAFSSFYGTTPSRVGITHDRRQPRVVYPPLSTV